MQDSVEVGDVDTERIRVSLLQFSDSGLLSPFFIFFSFPGLSFILRRLNWLCEAKAGGQAEVWSIKPVNHFLFSLRTAVDW